MQTFDYKSSLVNMYNKESISFPPGLLHLMAVSIPCSIIPTLGICQVIGFGLAILRNRLIRGGYAHFPMPQFDEDFLKTT